MSDLEDWILRAQAGELDAFEHVVRAFERSLRAWTHAHCPPGGDAEDVAQRTFVEVYQHLSDFQTGTDFRAWLFTVAKFQMRTEITRVQRSADYHRRHAPDVLIYELSRRAELPESDSELKLEHLKGCLQKLDAASRELLAGRYDEGAPLNEIARRTQRSVGAIKKHLFVLRAKLLACVQSKFAREGV